jgi:uncharacterized membrane protein
MTWYTFFKSVHVIAAILWVGGAAMIQAYAFRITRTADARRQAEFAKDTEIVGMRVFMPSGIVLLLAAIGLMINGNWSWGQNWTLLGLVAFALSFATGAGFLGPESGRIAEAIARQGPESPEAQARIRRIQMISRVELAVLLAVVWNMVVKPVGQGGWFWGSLVVTAVVAAGVVASWLRSESREPALAPE